MAKTEGGSKSAKRKIEEVEEDADEEKQNSIKRFFRAPKEGKRRLACFAMVFFSFVSILPGPLALFGFISELSLDGLLPDRWNLLWVSLLLYSG